MRVSMRQSFRDIVVLRALGTRNLCFRAVDLKAQSIFVVMWGPRCTILVADSFVNNVCLNS